MLRSLFFSFIFLLVLAASAIAQKTVTIRLSNQKKEPVAFASVKIINRLDSTSIFNKVADSSGKAVFTIPAGQYAVTVTAINYQSLEKGISVNDNTSNFNFIIEPLGKTLETAVVTSKKPLMKQEDDKLIVDPENVVDASTSGYEVLEKTPGLFIDQDGNIYISSMTPASVQINGRDMKMSAADVATILKSLPPNSILRIEILKTPSAKYDATSSGGIVNVVLKKGVKVGMTGSVFGGIQQGVYGNQFAGFSLNNNNGKTNSSLTMNYGRRNSYEKIVTDRFFAPDSVLSQDAKTIYPSNNYFVGYSIGFPAGKKWEMDFSTSTSLNDFDNDTRNQSTIRKISTSQTAASILNLVNNDGNSLNFRSAINGTKKIDSLGSEWSNDVFYNYSHNKNDQVYDIFNTNFSQLVSAGDGTGSNSRHHLNFQSDLKLKMKKKFTLETGVRASLLWYNSGTDYFRENPIGNRQKDASRTNTFKYNENINSAYLQGAQTFGKDFVLKAGVRVENTNMRGLQSIPTDTSFSLHRTDLFPYVYLSKNLMKIASYDLRAYLVYRRTIVRPVYEQLNPFSKYIDEFLSEVGNPSLRPQFNQNYEANVSVDERPILAVGINDTRDIFSNVIYQTGNKAFRTYDNLGKNREWYFRGLGAIPPGGRYFFVAGAQYNHNFYQGVYENKPLSFKKGTWTFFTYQTFKVDKRSMITLNGFVRLKGQQQFYELSRFGSLNASINRKFLKDKLVATLSISDMFATNQNDFHIRQGSVDAFGYRKSDTRRIGINLRYSFGLRKKEENTNMFNAEPAIN